MRQPRRSRYEGYTPEQAIRALADDYDELEGVLDEHLDEDEKAFLRVTEAMQQWKLEALQSSRRQMYALVLALIPVLVSLLVIIATK